MSNFESTLKALNFTFLWVAQSIIDLVYYKRLGELFIANIKFIPSFYSNNVIDLENKIKIVIKLMVATKIIIILINIDL